MHSAGAVSLDGWQIFERSLTVYVRGMYIYVTGSLRGELASFVLSLEAFGDDI